MKVLDLALKASRKRQSLITGFIHLCYENLDHEKETIPVYENFCFVLTLLRTKTVENILEAKQLLQKLLSFQNDKLFPVYLHEYPFIRYPGLTQQLYPVIFYILKDFHFILGEAERLFLNQLLNSWNYTPSLNLHTPEQCAYALIYCQLKGECYQHIVQWWDNRAMAYKKWQKQEKQEPAITLYDLFLSEWSGFYSPRLLQDHASHIQGSLVYPISTPLTFTNSVYSAQYYLWGNGNPTHSLALESNGTIIETAEGCLIQLDDRVVENEVEVAYFLNVHPCTSILINGQKASSFQLNDQISILSEDKQFHLYFQLLQNSEKEMGKFWGHIYRGNRRGQLCRSRSSFFELYDWIIGLRTVQRSQEVTVQIVFKVLPYEDRSFKNA